MEETKDYLESGLAATTSVPVGIGYTPFIMVRNTLAAPTYALQNEIDGDKMIIRNRDTNALEIQLTKPVDKDPVKIYKYKGKNKDGYKKLLESVGQEVDENFIYSTLSGKEVYMENQIEYDSDFEEVDIKSMIQETYDDVHTILGKLYMLTNEGLPEGKEVTTNEAKRVIGNNRDICIFECSKGFYAINKKTLRRTNYFKNASDIIIQEDLNHEKF